MVNITSTKGHTLTEAMITVVIVGIVASLAAPLLVQVTNFSRQTNARGIIERDVRASLDMINRFTRQAQSATVVIDSISSSQPPYSRLTFTSSQGQAVSFYQSGNKLYMSLAGQTSLLTSNLAYIAFTYPRTDDTSLISVAITTQAPTYRGNELALQLSIQKVRIMN